MLKSKCYVGIICLVLITKCLKVSSDKNSSEENECELPWQQLHRKCVQFVNVVNGTSTKTWQQARTLCKNMSADLLSISSKGESKDIKSLIRTQVSMTYFLEWWIGLRQVNGTWQWVDYEEMYENIPEWDSGYDGHSHPEDNSLSEDQCAIINNRGLLKPKNCNRELRPFICEQLTAALSTEAPPTTKTTSTPVTERPNVETTGSTVSTPTRNSTVRPNTGRPSGTPRQHQATARPNTGRPSGTPRQNQTTGRPKTGRPTGTPRQNQTTGRPNNAEESKAKKPKEEDEFAGCFAVNHESTCPPVEAFGISWPRSEAGKMVKVSCGNGDAKWKCDKDPTCWKGEPDVKKCTSERVQELTAQAEEFLANTSNSELALAFTDNLAAAAESGDMTSEPDILESTKLMKTASNAKPRNSREAKHIVRNVAKCGSALVRKDKKGTWSRMSKESSRSIASYLLDSMESVGKNMLKNFDVPTVEKIEEENMEVELQVIDVNENGSSADDANFEGYSNSFAVPPENLKRFSTGGLARLVFIYFKTVATLLSPTDAKADDSSERQVISKVLSASLDEKPEGEPLIKPVIFTMKTENRPLNQELNEQSCSFWNFSLGFAGKWSQDGCSLKEYNDTHVTCQCDHLTNFAVLMDIHSTKITPVHATALSYITYVGIIISIICLFLTWVTFVCLSIRCIRGTRSSHGHGENNEYYGVSGSYTGSTAGTRSAQGERNSIHKNLAFCLFIAEVLFLAGIERTDNKVACAIIAGFLHYFFLSSFTWMFVEGIHILFMLIQVFDAVKSRLRYYYVIGYGAPLLIVAISALVYYEGYGTERFCWLTSDRMFIWSFAGPVAFILLINLAVLVYAMVTVCKHSEYVFEKDKSMFGSFKAWIQGAFAMEVLLGLTWVFGYFYISEEALPMAYLFTIFNSLQGLFIFVFHCILNKKVRNEYSRFINYSKLSSSGAHSSKGSHHPSGSDPRKSSDQTNGTGKKLELTNLDKDRRPSARSTTSA